MKYVIYARKSNESEEKQIKSIPDQLQEMAKISKGLEIVRCYTEERSAKEAGRPVFLDMMEFIRTGGAEAILTWKLDRLARNGTDGGRIIDAIRTGEVKEIRTSDGVHTEKDTLMFFFHFGVATIYSDNLRDNVVRGMKSSLEAGQYPFPAPLGYANAGKGLKVLDGDRAPLILKMFKLRATGAYSFEKLATVMKEEGLLTKSGNVVSKNSIAGMLSNSFYAGVINMGVRRNGLLRGTYNGTHAPIVSMELFRKVQSLESNTRPKSQEKLKRFFIFRGKVFCMLCHRACYPQITKINYRYYLCRTKDCQQKAISERCIEQVVEDELKKINFNNGTMQLIRDIISRKVHELTATRRAEHVKLQRRYQIVKTKMTKLLEHQLIEEGNEETYYELQQQLATEKESLKQKLNEFDVNDDEIIRDVEEFFKLAQSAYHSYKFVADENKPEVLRTLVSNLFVSGNSAKITFKKPFDAIYETSRTDWCTRQDSNL